MADFIKTILYLLLLVTMATCATDHFFPFGGTDGTLGVVINPSTQINIPAGICFRFFEICEDRVHVLENGLLSFRSVETSTTIEPFPTLRAEVPLIAPYWANVRLINGGTVYYREVTSGSELNDVSQVIKDAFDTPDVSSFTASWALIVTYDQVARNQGEGRCTFQVAIATDGTKSFAIFNYGDLEWSNGSPLNPNTNDAAAGFDAGENAEDPFILPRVKHFNVDGSTYPSIININAKTNTKNNVCGRLVFQIEGEQIQQPCPVQACPSDTDCGNGMMTCSQSGPVCVCDSGYTGQFCQESINDCVSANCNFGACVDGENSFTCSCLPGFTGQLCDVNINECEGVNCNGGQCIDGINSFTCCSNDGVMATSSQGSSSESEESARSDSDESNESQESRKSTKRGRRRRIGK